MAVIRRTASNLPWDLRGCQAELCMSQVELCMKDTPETHRSEENHAWALSGCMEVLCTKSVLDTPKLEKNHRS